MGRELPTRGFRDTGEKGEGYQRRLGVERERGGKFLATRRRRKRPCRAPPPAYPSTVSAPAGLAEAWPKLPLRARGCHPRRTPHPESSPGSSLSLKLVTVLQLREDYPSECTPGGWVGRKKRASSQCTKLWSPNSVVDSACTNQRLSPTFDNRLNATVQVA